MQELDLPDVASTEGERPVSGIPENEEGITIVSIFSDMRLPVIDWSRWWDGEFQIYFIHGKFAGRSSVKSVDVNTEDILAVGKSSVIMPL